MPNINVNAICLEHISHFLQYNHTCHFHSICLQASVDVVGVHRVHIDYVVVDDLSEVPYASDARSIRGDLECVSVR